MSADRLARLAVPPLVASVVVLAIAGVGPAVWALQIVAVALAALIASAGRTYVGHRRSTPTSLLVLGLALAALVLPLLTALPSPQRWLLVGPARLYVAPVVLPAALLAWQALTRATGRRRTQAHAALVLAGLLLALQPDTSQVLALLAAVTTIAWRGEAPPRTLIPVWIGLALATAWALTRPDPLQPVPHVEGVIALAFAHSIAAGLLVAGGEIALVAGLWRAGPTTGTSALHGLAAYYATLFVCAHAGLTPAPLIGVGAGPWLGYGLFVALASALRLQR